jgi:hypothetical protein
VRPDGRQFISQLLTVPRNLSDPWDPTPQNETTPKFYMGLGVNNMDEITSIFNNLFSEADRNFFVWCYNYCMSYSDRQCERTDEQIFVPQTVFQTNNVASYGRFRIEDHRSGKPSFFFNNKQCLNFDLEKDNLLYMYEQIKMFKGCEFLFNTTHRNGCAFGDGATRQVYNKLCNELVGTIMVKSHPYFMDINVDHYFWDSDENIELFVIFIGMVISSQCLLPYHLAPALLESISNKKLNMKELEFFMEKIDPETFSSVNKINSVDFKLLETDFDTPEEYFRSKVIGPMTQRKINIYNAISKYFGLFDSFHDYDVQTIDSTFSGLYELTSDHVLSQFFFEKQEYSGIWEEFVKSLTETELKQMLILFGNTLSLNKHYTINVSETLKTDIDIKTCFQIVTLNKKLFENVEYLHNLKIYFRDNDQISDSTNIYENYDNSFTLDSGLRFGVMEQNWYYNNTDSTYLFWLASSNRNHNNGITTDPSPRVSMMEHTEIDYPTRFVHVPVTDAYNRNFDGDNNSNESNEITPNIPHVQQIIGRGLRTNSHTHLPNPNSDDILFFYVDVPQIETKIHFVPVNNCLIVGNKPETKDIEKKKRKNINKNTIKRINNNIHYAKNNIWHKKNYH